MNGELRGECAELARALGEIAMTVQDWNLDVCMGCEGEPRPCGNPDCIVGSSWLALDRYDDIVKPGKRHTVEPDDTEDLLWSTWFEADPQTGPPANGPHRRLWMECQAYGIALVAHLPVADTKKLMARFTRQEIGENDLFSELARQAIVNGCDIYDSDSRFLIWPPGIRKSCDGDCCTA